MLLEPRVLRERRVRLVLPVPRARPVLPAARLLVDRDPHGLDALHRQMGVGDQRLPFALALDAQGRGCWASANYNIRTAQTLYKVLTLAEG